MTPPPCWEAKFNEDPSPPYWMGLLLYSPKGNNMPAKTHYIFVFFGIYAHSAWAVVGFWEVVQPWNVIGVPRVSESHMGEGSISLLLSGDWGSSPKKIFWYNMSVKAILIHFEAILSCESKLILQALSYISNAYDNFFWNPTFNVSYFDRWISSGGGSKLATGVVFLKLFWVFCGGSSFIHTSKHFIHMNMGSQQPDKRA